MDKTKHTSPILKTKSFYSGKPSPRSKNWKEKQEKCEAKFQEYRKRPIHIPRLLRLDDPIPVFKRFPLQRLAFDYAKSCSKDVHVFSEEIEYGGKRRYLVATFDQFWEVYRKLEPNQRHYYEVIIEGAACKLYFDLEFSKDFNAYNSGIEMIDIFIKYVSHQIKQSFEITCDRKHVIDLDSSTEAKFSRHLIFCLPNAVFKDNIHVGKFVSHICSSIMNLVHNYSPSNDKAKETEETPAEGPKPKVSRKNINENITERYANGVAVEDLKKLLILNNKGEVVTFCDQGVYTKNRNFRVYKSLKLGKNASLELAKENMFKPDMKNRKGSFSGDPNYALFLDSLISNVSYNDSNHSNLRQVKVLRFESEIAKPGKRPRPSSTDHSEQLESLPSGYQHSPFPQIDDFISSVINKGGVQGRIRRWVYFAQGKVLMFDIDKNKWCENIGRAHRSNHIIMVVDMRQGMYYQKCHDPECKKIDFRSAERPIPEDINPFYHENEASEQLAVWGTDLEDDDMLYQIAEETEKSQHEEKNKTTSEETAAQDDHDLSSLLEDDESWEPWKDLPICNEVIAEASTTDSILS